MFQGNAIFAEIATKMSSTKTVDFLRKSEKKEHGWTPKQFVLMLTTSNWRTAYPIEWQWSSLFGRNRAIKIEWETLRTGVLERDTVEMDRSSFIQNIFRGQDGCVWCFESPARWDLIENIKSIQIEERERGRSISYRDYFIVPCLVSYSYYVDMWHRASIGKVRIELRVLNSTTVKLRIQTSGIMENICYIHSIYVN